MTIREAELFVQAEDVLVEVLGRVGSRNWGIVLPAMFDAPGAGKPLSIKENVARYVAENARVPEVLTGATANGGGRPDEDVLGAARRLSTAACAAARTVTDGDVKVHSSFGELTAGEYLWRLDITRCFLAHDIAMHLGSRACPLTEELARGMWEGTAPDAERWRELGYFREPLPLPADVSWRDRFLLSAGRDPHPLVH